MNLENQLIKKIYYKGFMREDEAEHPVRVLGEAFLSEQRNELYDLSPIRFAQGEIYYHNRDFEAAIFKWENVTNELEQWAKKNMADCYYELGLLSIAEDIYTSIQTECMILSAETALQLFSLYKKQEKIDLAYKVIKKIVCVHPEYPNVIESARAFYEEQEDWDNAIDLAVQEAIRTKSLNMFETLIEYIDKGYTKTAAPTYFYEVLCTSYTVSEAHFEQLVFSLWNSYKNGESYLIWMKTINDVFLNIDIQSYDTWRRISGLYEETYCELIEGQYLLRQLHEVIPNLLANWLKTTNPSQALFVSAAVWAWNENFPSAINSSTVTDAEKLIFHSSHEMDGLAYSRKIYESIMEWTRTHNLQAGQKFEWWVNRLADIRRKHLLVIGLSERAKSSFIDSLLGDHGSGNAGSRVVIIADNDEKRISEISNDGIRHLSDLSDVYGREEVSGQSYVQETFIEWNVPCEFLKENDVSLINTPVFGGSSTAEHPAFEYVSLADGLLFIMDANEPFTQQEIDIVMKLQELTPHIPVHFVLNNRNNVDDEEKTISIMEEVKGKIHAYFPDAEMYPYLLEREANCDAGTLDEFITTSFQFISRNFREERTEKLLLFMRKTLKQLLEKRTEAESKMIHAMKWNEEMVTRLNGFINNVVDLEKEKVNIISNSYHIVREEIEKDIAEDIPEVLRECADLISRDSDFRQVHLMLNEKMNERIQQYLQQEVLPKFRTLTEEWIDKSHKELSAAQIYLEEMGETFNNMYEEEKLQLECDFKIVDDWRRDVYRMTSRLHIEEENILLRFNPSQLLLKSAGKLFGSIPQNSTLLYKQYKKYLENENYDHIASSIISKVFLQFDLFEKALEMDVAAFFQNSMRVLNEAVEEARSSIAKSRDMLEKMKSKPEDYYDPLSLFELRLRQYELMIEASKEIGHREAVNV